MTEQQKIVKVLIKQLKDDKRFDILKKKDKFLEHNIVFEFCLFVFKF